MTKQCRYMLKQIKELTNNTTLEFSYNNSKCVLFDIRKHEHQITLNKYHGELDSLISVLLTNGYLINTQFGFRLTHKGIHPCRVTLEEIKLFFLKSVIIPVIVSVTTALVTMWIKGLL